MKTCLRIFIWGLLLAGSFHSNAKDFKWRLDYNQGTILSGVITASHRSRSEIVVPSGCDRLTFEDCRTFDSAFTYDIMIQNQSGLGLPPPFSILLNDGSSNFSHQFNLHYTFGAQTISIARNLGIGLCLLCCFPCSFVHHMLTARLCCEPGSGRMWDLNTARPGDVHGNVQVHERSLSHQCFTDNPTPISSSTYSDISAATTVLDLFMVSDWAQQWLENSLDDQVQPTQMIMIPGLLNSEQSTEVSIQHNSEAHDSRTPTHFLTFTTGGVTIQYHLNQSPGYQIGVLAIVVTYGGYTMVINLNGYEVPGGQPLPLSEIEINTCSCTVVCTCKNSRRNDSDDTGAASGSSGWSGKPYLLPSTGSF